MDTKHLQDQLKDLTIDDDMAKSKHRKKKQKQPPPTQQDEEKKKIKKDKKARKEKKNRENQSKPQGKKRRNSIKRLQSEPQPQLPSHTFLSSQDPHSVFPPANPRETPLPPPPPPQPASVPPHLRTTQSLSPDFFRASSPLVQEPEQASTQPGPRRSARIAKAFQTQSGSLNLSQPPTQNDPPISFSFSRRTPRKPSHTIPEPKPTPSYTINTQRPPQRLSHPQKLLVVLDLNGVLVHRRKTKSNISHVPRPDLLPFLDYLFANHNVMIWSSGMPSNVSRIIQKALSPSQSSGLVATWARDTLRLPPHLFDAKVQVYKQLSWIWDDEAFKLKARELGAGPWSQKNTVLVDDSREKAAAEPWNLVCVDEFTNAVGQREGRTLLDVVEYLEDVRCYDDVSAAMRLTPFVLRTTP